ncbi:hypothetical protein GX586_08580, partial [bacterium]|nr:hypothetical protein [bacterium]
QLTLNGLPLTVCPTNDTVHCADADDAVFYETFYYDAQCEPQYRNIPVRDAVRTQPAPADFSGVPVFTTDADPVPPISVAMEPFGDQVVLTNTPVQLFWHVFDVASGPSNATILLDGSPIAVHTTQNPVTVNPPVGAGQHQWQVIGMDNAGNVSTSAVATFFVDVPEPALFISMLLAGAAMMRRGQRQMSNVKCQMSDDK